MNSNESTHNANIPDHRTRQPLIFNLTEDKGAERNPRDHTPRMLPTAPPCQRTESNTGKRHISAAFRENVHCASGHPAGSSPWGDIKVHMIKSGRGGCSITVRSTTSGHVFSEEMAPSSRGPKL